LRGLSRAHTFNLYCVDRSDADPGRGRKTLARKTGCLPCRRYCGYAGRSNDCLKMAQSSAQAELAHLNRIAELARRGAPLGELGRVGPVTPAHKPRDDAEPQSLMLASGLLDDDGRRPLIPDDDLYGLFEHALRWQDTWSEHEHASFWQGSLGLWPPNRGKRGHTYTLAYALVIAVEAGVDLADFLRRLSDDLRPRAITGLTAEEFTLRGLQRQDAVRAAIQMLSAPRHLYPDSGRLPRVVTDEEIVPHLAVAHNPLDAHSKAGDASGEIVRAALRVVKLARKLPNRDALGNIEDGEAPIFGDR
jgi:hypothetical protein